MLLNPCTIPRMAYGPLQLMAISFDKMDSCRTISCTMLLRTPQPRVLYNFGNNGYASCFSCKQISQWNNGRLISPLLKVGRGQMPNSGRSDNQGTRRWSEYFPRAAYIEPFRG